MLANSLCYVCHGTEERDREGSKTYTVTNPRLNQEGLPPPLFTKKKQSFGKVNNRLIKKLVDPLTAGWKDKTAQKEREKRYAVPKGIFFLDQKL